MFSFQFYFLTPDINMKFYFNLNIEYCQRQRQDRSHQNLCKGQYN